MAKKFEGKDWCCTCFKRDFPDTVSGHPCDICFSNHEEYSKSSLNCKSCNEKNNCKYSIVKSDK